MRINRLRYKHSICFILQTIDKHPKCDSSIIIKLFIYLTFATGVLFTGCVHTEGTLEIKGKVVDEYTKVLIPGRDIIIQGLVRSNNKFVPIDAGQFSTDSSGNFSYSFRKVKDARYYNFSLVGDSDYALRTRTLGLMELEQNAKYLSFSLSKLADLTIIITRKSKTPVSDTLSLCWESNGVYENLLYPYKINNYGKANNSFGLTSDKELRWIGGNVNSTIHTKVFADKRTKLLWDLDRNGKRMEFIDTIRCKRNLPNIVYFTY
jgi:hypothetical protein